MNLSNYSEKEEHHMATEIDYMETKRGLNIGSLLIGVAIGAVVGGVTALLLAPKSGKETQEMIRGKAVETQEMLKERYSDVKERIGKIRDTVVSRAEEEAQKAEKKSPAI
jgi:gas vesicle protein